MLARRRGLWVALMALMTCATAALAVDEMPGQWGELGRNYTTTGRGHKLLYRVTALEYRVDPVIIGKEAYAPKADEKLLVVHYVLQNAQTTNYTVSWSSLTMTVVDSTEATCKGVPAMGNEIDKQPVNIELKPAQKIEVYRVFRVAAAGPAKKLIVYRVEPPVVRFDLVEKCKPTPLAKELADPADATGATPAQPLAAKLGQKLPLGPLQITVDSWQPGQPTCEGKAPKEGRQWVYVTATATNLAPEEERLQFSAIRPRLLVGEDQIKSRMGLWQVETDQVLKPGVLAPGASRTIRWVFDAPAELTAPKLALEWQSTDRQAVLELPAP